MKAVPSYSKILTLGSSGTENALVGHVVVQEKVDGSQFAFGINEDGELVMRSKSVPMTVDNHAEMFDEAVDFVQSTAIVKLFKKEIYFYCEYLSKPKHNTLSYSKIPNNHLVLFDVLDTGKGFQDRYGIVSWARALDIDVIPELYAGRFERNQIDELLQKESYLGGQKIEGVVIKNYEQNIILGGNVFPLFTKYVSEAFKEKHSIDWKIRQPKDTLENYIKGFKSEARWQKAIIHAKEKGILTNSPKDIGPLLKFIQIDIIEEEKENIKNHLYNCFYKDIMRHSVSGFPEWYKKKLLENLVTS